MSCPLCKAPFITRNMLGAWFLTMDEEDYQINYCPECGKMLDAVGAAEMSERIRAAEGEP